MNALKIRSKTAIVLFTFLFLALTLPLPRASAATNVEIAGLYYETFSGAITDPIDVTIYATNTATAFIGANSTHILLYDGYGSTEPYPYSLTGNVTVINFEAVANGNVTRAFYPFAGESIYLVIPASGAILNPYVFNIIDIAALKWGYIEYALTNNGVTYPIERVSIKNSNPPTFYMAWGKTYSMKLYCDKGTISLPEFTAGATSSTTITISPDMFYTAPVNSNDVVFTATMDNITNQINLNYANPFSDTKNVTFLLYQQGISTPVLNETYSLQDSVSLTYNYADPTAYTAKLIAYTDTFGVITRTVTLLYVPQVTPAHPFAILRNFGSLPFDAANIPAIAILLVVALAIGWHQLTWGLILEVLLTAILVYIGWLSLSWSWVGVVAAIGFILAFSEQKSREKG